MWRKTASQKLSSRPETGENHEPGSGEKWIVYEEARSVTTWDHIFSDHIFSDNIFSDFIQSVRLRRRLPGMEPSSLLTSWKSSE
ncbi:hypothetical protein YC2023_098660 [Brassica napus]